MALAFRFEYGVGISANCESAVVYLEQPARLATQYVERTYGLDTIEKDKLKLIGPDVLPDKSLLLNHSMRPNTNSVDIIELLNLQGQYGSSESLNYLGISYMQGFGGVKRDFRQAKEFFLKSLKVNSTDPLANYELGVICLLGLGEPVDIQKAISYFEVVSSDPQSLNALGVISYGAPDVFESDPVRLHGYGKIRRDVKKARKYFEQAASGGNLNAKFNLGVLWMDPSSDQFSYSKAYDSFKFAASKGHTMSSYNLGVMH
jgi:TPR repeat protein